MGVEDGVGVPVELAVGSGSSRGSVGLLEPAKAPVLRIAKQKTKTSVRGDILLCLHTFDNCCGRAKANKDSFKILALVVRL